MKKHDACLLCDEAAQGWQTGGYGYPGHECLLCARHCAWEDTWARYAAAGRADDMRALYLRTQARARGSRGPAQHLW